MIQEITRKKFLRKLEEIKYGSLTVTDSKGKKYFFKGDLEGEDADVIINNWSFVLKLIATGDIGFAESYRDNVIETSNIEKLVAFALMNCDALDSYLHSSLFGKLLHGLIYLVNTNTIIQSKRNINKHYDLGNKFYSSWLDDSMTYSSGIFSSSDDDLCEAQRNKYNRIIQGLNYSGSLLEIGCGWGGFLDQALNSKDFDAKGITISSQQLSYSQDRLKGKASIAFEDYRHQKGKFDNIVSIEMFEAVGKKYWNVYFQKIKELLSHNGKAMIQTITIDESISHQYQKGTDFIRSFIFPGGMLPTESQFKYYANKNGLKVTDLYRFGNCYSRTLDIWSRNFMANLELIKNLGFDNKFIRLWNLYLTSCSASFALGKINVMQVQLVHDQL